MARIFSNTPLLRASLLVLFPLLALPLSAPVQANGFKQCGKASWYKLGGKTASGESADPSGLTAAHRTLPFGTIVEVTNLSNGKSVRVRINDRGPFAKGRVIDVTLAAARELGFVNKGVTRVEVTGTSPDLRPNTTQKCQ